MNGTWGFRRDMGAYRPHFETRPMDFYESKTSETCAGGLLILLVVCLMLGVVYGLFRWTLDIGTNHFTLVWCLVLIAYSCFFIAAAFYFSRQKSRQGAQLIKEAISKQERKNFNETEVGLLQNSHEHSRAQ